MAIGAWVIDASPCRKGEGSGVWEPTLSWLQPGTATHDVGDDFDACRPTSEFIDSFRYRSSDPGPDSMERSGVDGDSQH